MSLLDYVRDRHSGYQIKLENQQLRLLASLGAWWYDQQQIQLMKVISHPFNNKSYITLFYFLFDQVIKLKKNVSILFIVDSSARKKFLLQFSQQILNRFFSHHQGTKKLPIINSVYSLSADNSQITLTTFKQFVKHDLHQDNIYNYMLIETGNFLRTFRDGFSDYITDTYLRRAYIQALRFNEAYRQIYKPKLDLQKRMSSNDVEQLNPMEQILNSMGNEKKSNQAQRQKQRQIINGQNRRVNKVFNNKRQQLIKGVKNKQENKLKLFETSELILISSIIYLIGFFYNQLQTKKTRTFTEFIDDYQIKACLNKQFLEKVLHYYEKIYRNCPTKIYNSIEQTYLYSFCQFVNKIMRYRKIFLEDERDLFEIKIQKYPFDRRQSIIEQSSYCIFISCKQNNKICKRVIDRKCLSAIVLQNFACPQEYWYHVFRKHQKLLNSYDSKDSHKFSKLYGLHISKTPSNEDLNFSEKLKPDIETIKIKSCGVLLYDLSKFIPDGIVVYFHSVEGLENFSKEMERDEQKILKRIDNNKKIFTESLFEQENVSNYEKFKKCCQIGRGAMFLMVANGKAAQNLRFYNQLSRCIVFFGLPRREHEGKKDHRGEGEPGDEKKMLLQNLIQNTEKISIFNECINNCINDIQECKSIIFVGRQITDDLQKWFKLFIRSWDETTRQSLMKLRNHFQKMGSSSTGFTLPL